MYANVKRDSKDSTHATVLSVYDTLDDAWKFCDRPSMRPDPVSGGFWYAILTLPVLGSRRPMPGESLPIKFGKEPDTFAGILTE